MNRTQSQINSVLRIELVGHMITDQSWDGFSHQHDFEELVYVMKGAIVCHCGEKQVALTKGQMMIVLRKTLHQITADEPSSFLYVGFKSNLADLTHCMMQRLDCEQDPNLLVLKTELEEIAQRVFSGNGSFSDYVPQIMSAMIPAIGGMGKAKEEESAKIILSNQIKQYIKHHFQQPIRVDEIAAGLYHSPHYLGNVFSAVNGITIKEYVMQFKMQKAIALLQSDKRSVTEVAALLGYESPHYFSKCFKNYYGFSPSSLKRKDAVQ